VAQRLANHLQPMENPMSEREMEEFFSEENKKVAHVHLQSTSPRPVHVHIKFYGKYAAVQMSADAEWKLFQPPKDIIHFMMKNYAVSDVSFGFAPNVSSDGIPYSPFFPERTYQTHPVASHVSSGRHSASSLPSDGNRPRRRAARSSKISSKVNATGGFDLVRIDGLPYILSKYIAIPFLWY